MTGFAHQPAMLLLVGVARRKRQPRRGRLPDDRRFARVPLAAAALRLRGEALSLLIAICGYADAAGQCWPSTVTLARDTGLDRRHLSRAMHQLVEAGLVAVQPQPGGCNRYQIVYDTSPTPEPRAAHLPCATDGAPSCATDGAPSCATGGAFPAPRVAQKQTTNSPIEHMRAARGPSECENDFAALWSAYPHRPGDPKERARAAFGRAVANGVEATALIAAARGVEDQEPQYRPHLDKWIREGRWRTYAAGADGATSGSSSAAPPGMPDTEARKLVAEWLAKGGRSRDWDQEKNGLPPNRLASRVSAAVAAEFGIERS